MKKITPILQMSETECGLCSAIMLMDYYEVSLNLSDLSKRFVVGRDGTSIGDLKEIFNYYKFDTKIYQVLNNLSDLEPEALPCIIFHNKGHFVILEKIKNDNAIVIDSAIGRLKISNNNLNKNYKKIIIKISPSKKLKKQNSRGKEFDLIRNSIVQEKRLLLRVLFYAISVYALSLIVPIILKIIVNDFLDIGTTTDNIKKLTYIILLSSLGYYVINRLKLIASVRMSVEINKKLVYKVIDKLFKNKFEYFLNRSSSDIQYRLILLKNLETMISDVFIQAILDVGSMFVIFIYILQSQIYYAILLIFITLIVLMISFIIKNKMLLNKNDEISKDNKLQMIQYDIFRSIFDVKVLGLSQEKKAIWSNSYKEYINSHQRTKLFSSFFQGILSYITLYIPIFIPLLGIWLSRGKSQIGTIIALQSMTGIYINSLISISQLSETLTTIGTYVGRINDILIQDDEKERHEVIDFNGNIKVENLAFSYPGSKIKVLQNINFSIKEGESVAIVGESGSGKSTLFYILLGAYDNYQGKVIYEGVDLSILNKDKLRKQIGVVPQNSLLFSGSIRENLTQDEHISDGELFEILQKVSLDDFVKSLPMKLNTIISENAFNLSGGQKQRIALARAILNKKAVLFLDEATSSLDNMTEHKVVNYLSEGSNTKIVIAHRLSTVRDSDKIIVLKEGRVVEIGNHDELLSKKGEYYKMYFRNSNNSISEEGEL